MWDFKVAYVVHKDSRHNKHLPFTVREEWTLFGIITRAYELARFVYRADAEQYAADRQDRRDRINRLKSAHQELVKDHPSNTRVPLRD